MYVCVRVCVRERECVCVCVRVRALEWVSVFRGRGTAEKLITRTRTHTHVGLFTPTEHWAALINPDNFGLGVVNTGVTTFLGGFSGAKGSGGPHDPPTGYLAPTRAVQLGADEDFTFTSYIVLGNLPDIRAYAKGKVASRDSVGVGSSVDLTQPRPGHTDLPSALRFSALLGS